MKRLISALIMAAILIPVTLFAKNSPGNGQGWGFSVGAGAVYAPKYLGDDESQLSFIPNIRVTYEDRFFASLGDGMGYTIINNKNLKSGLIATYDFGRKEDGSNPLGMGDDTNDLLGLGDVDGTVEMGAFAEYIMSPFTITVEMRKGLNGHEGWVGKASIEYGGKANVYGQRYNYAFGPKIKYTDSNYNEAFFSVNAAQSAASGLSVYDASDAAFSYGIGGRLIVPHTTHISTVIIFDYIRLGDVISDSSLVSERGSGDQMTLGFFTNYTF